MTAADFVSILFLSRDVAHRVHLCTRSYAKHKALDEFYHGIIDHADEFAEIYQGCYGLIGNIPIRGTKGSKDIVSFLQGIADEIQSGRNEITDDTPIQNKIDEIMGFIYSTIYKLRFLA